MSITFPRFAPLLSLALVAACSQQEAAAPGNDVAANTTAQSAAPVANAVSDNASTPATNTAAPAATPGEALTLDGLGDLVIGKAVPKGSRFSSQGMGMPGSDCQVLKSPDYPGVYAMTDKGIVRRITVEGGSPVKLVEGVGPGSTEAQVLAALPGFRASPHKYVNAPGKYLTQPGNDPRLRFEIGEDGKVSAMHVGMMPQLAYVEGCS